MENYKLMNLIKSFIIYGFVAILAKGLQFFSVMYLENYLSVELFVDYGLKYAFQTGILVFTIFGINEGMISKYVKVKNKEEILIYAEKIVLLGQLSLCVPAICLLYFFDSINYIYPLVNGVILGQFMMTSAVFKLTENHSRARIFLYVPQVIFHVIIVLTAFFGLENDPFLFSSIVLISFLFISRGTKIIKILKTNFDWNYSKEIIIESFSFYSMASLAWVSGFGFTWVIKYLYSDTDVANFVYIYTFSGVILLFTNSVFNVWNPYYLNSIDKIKLHIENNIYHLVTLMISLLSIITALLLNLIRDDFNSLTINFALLFSSFVFYVPIWRARLYFQKLKLGYILLRITFFSSALSYLIFFCISKYIGPHSVYLFFLVNSIILCLFSSNSLNHLKGYQVNYMFSFLVGAFTILSISLINFNIWSVLFILIIILFLLTQKALNLKKIW